MKYEHYLNSKQWRIKKNEVFAKHGFFCARCGDDRKGHLNIHHANYKHLGNEKPNELYVLCRNCHAEYHALFGNEPSIFTTQKFIAGTLKKKKKEQPKIVYVHKRPSIPKKPPTQYIAEKLALKQLKAEYALEQMKKLKELKL